MMMETENGCSVAFDGLLLPWVETTESRQEAKLRLSSSGCFLARGPAMWETTGNQDGWSLACPSVVIRWRVA